LAILLASSCLPQSQQTSSGQNITLYGFSILKEALEKGVFPAFAAKWKREHGRDVSFTASYAGSDTITNQILQGVEADVAILSIERDAVGLTAFRVLPNSTLSSERAGHTVDAKKQWQVKSDR
jgi:ABC-type sulfate transport system substrate-binding protein